MATLQLVKYKKDIIETRIPKEVLKVADNARALVIRKYLALRKDLKIAIDQVKAGKTHVFSVENSIERLRQRILARGGFENIA